MYRFIRHAPFAEIGERFTTDDGPGLVVYTLTTHTPVTYTGYGAIRQELSNSSAIVRLDGTEEPFAVCAARGCGNFMLGHWDRARIPLGSCLHGAMVEFVPPQVPPPRGTCWKCSERCAARLCTFCAASLPRGAFGTLERAREALAVTGSSAAQTKAMVLLWRAHFRLCDESRRVQG